MDIKEVRLLLSAISVADNRKLDHAVANDWKRRLDRSLNGRATLDAAMHVVDEWFDTDRDKYFTIGILIDEMKKGLRLTPKAVTDDVRAAKSRGLIEASWPRNEPLAVEVQAQLLAARARDREVAAQYAIEGPNVPGVELEVGRTV